MTALLRNHWKRRMCSDPCICTTQQYSSSSFQQSFAQNLKNISLIIWYCCNILRPYKISNILYKTNEKAVSFLLTTSGTSCNLSWRPSFSWPHGVSLFGNIERCVVVSFSGLSSIRPVYPSFHLSVLWAEVVSNPRCLSVIHTLHFSLLYSYLTQCFRQLYSQLIFTQTKIVTNEGTIASSSSAIAVRLNYY